MAHSIFNRNRTLASEGSIAAVVRREDREKVGELNNSICQLNRSSFRRGIVVACLNINSLVARIDELREILAIALKLIYCVLMRQNSTKLLAIMRSVYRVLILLEEIGV